MLIRQGRQLTPVEIKSANTFSVDFLKGIKRFREAAGEEDVNEGFVLFNGEQVHQVQGVRVMNPLLLDGWPVL